MRLNKISVNYIKNISVLRIIQEDQRGIRRDIRDKTIENISYVIIFFMVKKAKKVTYTYLSDLIENWFEPTVIIKSSKLT